MNEFYQNLCALSKYEIKLFDLEADKPIRLIQRLLI